MPAKVKVEKKKCRQLIRTADGKQEQCGLEYTTASCPESDGPHLFPLKTGYCSSGWHEGDKAKDWRGNPAPTCEYWETCPCTCHDMISMMFDMSGRERIPVNNSAYRVEHTYWMPTEADRTRWAQEKAAASNASGAVPAVVIESPAPGIVPPTVARTFRPTASGRSARGELEAWINRTCSEWLLASPPWDCTPRFISERIAKVEGIEPPSTGAITAALDKWVKIGYAEVSRKPVRFIKFTEEGARHGLEGMKDKARRGTAAFRNQMERGVLR